MRNKKRPTEIKTYRKDERQNEGPEERHKDRKTTNKL